MKFVAALALLCATSSLAETTVLNRRIQKDQTLAKALHEAGLDEHSVDAVTSSLKTVFDLRKSRPGDQFRAVVSDGAVDWFDYRRDSLNEWNLRREGDQLIASKREVEVENRVELIELSIESSVWDAAKSAGEDPSVAIELSDVFAWDIDFYRDVQEGDRVRAIIEKTVARNGRVLGYGNILAAEYNGSAVGRKRVFRYESPKGDLSYFLEDGSSARKTFLKSPLKFANITSGFGTRLHPILNYVGTHYGVDYGTPIGTPVWAVADGTVVRAGWDNGGGNMVCVRHINALETCYLHLSKFGEGVKVGAHVLQKQVIAYSGTTGLSTGPHLHFALKRGGVFVNPLNQNFPRADPVAKEFRADFLEKIAPFKNRLDATSVAAAQVSTPELVQ